MCASRRTGVLVVVGLVATAATASAAPKPKTVPKKQTRTLTLAYSFAGATTHTAVGLGSVQGCGPTPNCLSFSTTKNEKYISISTKDAAGQSVGVSIYPDTGTNGVSTETFYCASAQSADIAPASAWTLAADTLTVDPACPGLATQGTVTIILSNRP